MFETEILDSSVIWNFKPSCHRWGFFYFCVFHLCFACCGHISNPIIWGAVNVSLSWGKCEARAESNSIGCLSVCRTFPGEWGSSREKQEKSAADALQRRAGEEEERAGGTPPHHQDGQEIASIFCYKKLPKKNKNFICWSPYSRWLSKINIIPRIQIMKMQNKREKLKYNLWL